MTNRQKFNQVQAEAKLRGLEISRFGDKIVILVPAKMFEVDNLEEASLLIAAYTDDHN